MVSKPEWLQRLQKETSGRILSTDSQHSLPLYLMPFNERWMETGTHLISCFTAKRNSYRFRTTWGRVNNDDVLIFVPSFWNTHARERPGASFQDHRQGNRNGQQCFQEASPGSTRADRQRNAAASATLRQAAAKLEGSQAACVARSARRGFYFTAVGASCCWRDALAMDSRLK